MNILDNIGQAQMNAVTEQREIPEFGPGDTLKINVKVVEGSRERVQAFEGVCIGRSNRGINSSFTVRKISYGEGVERIFPLYSPKIQAIEVVRRGDVRRAKLYYLRGRTGKAARIAEKTVRAPARSSYSKITFNFAFLKVSCIILIVITIAQWDGRYANTKNII